MKMFNDISLFFATVGGILSHYLGGYDSLLKAIITLIVIDYVTGLVKGIYNKELSSNIGSKGIVKKIMVFLVIATSVVIKSIINVDIPIREITIMFFIANEGISILENSSEFIPIPKQLTDILIQIRGDTGE